jgi:hypothetical protein
MDGKMKNETCNLCNRLIVGELHTTTDCLYAQLSNALNLNKALQKQVTELHGKLAAIFAILEEDKS